MQRFKMIHFVLAVVILLQCFDRIDACSCQPRHPQQHFCDADFVILARVKRESVVNGTREYKIKIRKEYKMSEKSLVALKFGRLLTAASDGMCGVRLEVNRVYAISGRVVTLQARINTCNMLEPWDDLTRRQRKGLKLMYRQGCTCDIRFCPPSSHFHGGCPRSQNACNWDSWQPDKRRDCQRNEGICLRNSKKLCIWSRNLALTTCTRNATVMHYEPRPIVHDSPPQLRRKVYKTIKPKKRLPSPDDPDRTFGQ